MPTEGDDEVAGRPTAKECSEKVHLKAAVTGFKAKMHEMPSGLVLARTCRMKRSWRMKVRMPMGTRK